MDQSNKNVCVAKHPNSARPSSQPDPFEESPPFFFTFFLLLFPFFFFFSLLSFRPFYYNNKNTNTTIRTNHPYLPTFGFNGKLLALPTYKGRGGNIAHSSPPAPSCLIRKHGERQSTLLPFLLFHFHLAIDHS